MKFISVRSTLIFIVCAGITISSSAQSGAITQYSGEGCEPDLDPAPPDARQGDLFGAEPFDRRDGRQIYVSLLVLVVPLLPGEPASVAQPERRGAELRPFAAPVAGLRHRRDALSGELQPAKSMWPAALPIPKIPSPGCDARTMVEGGRMNRRADHSLIVNSSARSFGT